MELRALVSAIALVTASASGCRQPQPTTTLPAVAPSSGELRSLLDSHANHPFDAAARERGCPADQSLGEYVATLVRNTTPDGSTDDIHRFSIECTSSPAWSSMPLDPPRDAEHWACRIDAYTSDRAGDSPWHYELRFRVRQSNRALDLATLACPGGS